MTHIIFDREVARENLARFYRIREKLEAVEAGCFTACLLGVLAARLSAEVWSDALEAAIDHYKQQIKPMEQNPKCQNSKQ